MIEQAVQKFVTFVRMNATAVRIVKTELDIASESVRIVNSELGSASELATPELHVHFRISPFLSRMCHPISKVAFSSRLFSKFACRLATQAWSSSFDDCNVAMT